MVKRSQIVKKWENNNSKHEKTAHQCLKKCFVRDEKDHVHVKNRKKKLHLRMLHKKIKLTGANDRQLSISRLNFI